VLYGWIIVDNTSLILITALLCLAMYFSPNMHEDWPERAHNNQPVTETVSSGSTSQDKNVTATPAYNPNTNALENQ
jgi:hypothetical protein